ncbi:MAG: phosphate-starvation-inducible PsiE family protein [Gammaproteobacteria bacterium]
MNFNLAKLFNGVVSVVFSVMLLFLTVGLVIGTVQLVIDLWSLLRFEGVTGHYLTLVTDVLTLFILIELSRSLVDYFSAKRLRLTFVADAAIVFVIREVMIGLFKDKLQPADLYALSVLLLVLGALRIGSAMLFQRDRVLARAEAANHREAR